MCNAHVWSPIRMSKLPGFYDKAHLFDVEIPGEEDQTERVWLHRERWIDCFPCWVTRRSYRFGNRKNLNVNRFPQNKIQTSVISSNFCLQCYDVRFPEFSLSLARMGADIITYPSAFTVTTGLAHWESLLRARAIETQCFVVAAAQTGIS